jgi:hypothetical protein
MRVRFCAINNMAGDILATHLRPRQNLSGSKDLF